MAEREAIHHRRTFFSSRRVEFEAVPHKGWPRPWNQDGTLPAIFGQMVMAHVGASLEEYWGTVQNTYRDLVTGSSLTAEVRHRLRSINRHQLEISISPRRPMSSWYFLPSNRKGTSKNPSLSL